MTISTEVRKAGPFEGNGSTTLFPFAFKVFRAEDMIVVRRDETAGVDTILTLTSDYTVSLNADQNANPGGNIVLAAPLAYGNAMVVSSELPFLQPTDLTNQGGFYPKVITNALDRLTIFCQQLKEGLGRSLSLPITAPSGVSTELPFPTANNVIGWDESAIKLRNFSQQEIATIAAYGDTIADQFTGDGTTATFTLTKSPGGINNLDVSVGGVTQRPIYDYTWDFGTHITFTTAPASPGVPGAKNILVRYAQALPQNDNALKEELASVNGASLSLSQIATSYGIPFADLGVWSPGSSSALDKYWWHGNRVWQSNAPGHVLEATPTFSTAHIVPVDGVLYPDHFGASYIPGTDQTPAIQRCENWQKPLNAPLRLRSVEHTLLTKLVITRAPCIVAEAGGYGVTTASPASSQRRPQGAVLVGKVVGDFSVVVSPALFEFGGQIENVTITGKESVGATKTVGKGVRLHNFGWSGRVKGLSVLDFDGKGLEIGYLQDTVFDQLSVLGCGPTSAQRALSFTSNSNYIYFNNAHIEDGNYLLGCAEAPDKPWEVHWKGAHFESGDYNGALGPEFDHSYTLPPIEIDGCYRWYWDEPTMVPASVQRLQSVNGGDTASQPYFMRGANTSRIFGNKMRFICPRDTGGIDAMELLGDYSGNNFTDVSVEGAQGAKYVISMESGTLVGGAIGFTVPTEVKMYGVNINRGFVDKLRFANNAGGTAKTSGYLINSAVEAALTSGEHSYDLGTPPSNWIGQFVHSIDCRINDYFNIVNGAVVNMEKVRPDNAFYNGTAGAVVANIVNCQRSRRIKFRNDAGGTLTITASGGVKPDGAVNAVIPAQSSYVMKADHTGVLYRD